VAITVVLPRLASRCARFRLHLLMALKWPSMCWCAVKKLLTHSLTFTHPRSHSLARLLVRTISHSIDLAHSLALALARQNLFVLARTSPVGSHSLKLARTRLHLLSLACPLVDLHLLELAFKHAIFAFRTYTGYSTVLYSVWSCIANCLFLTSISTCAAAPSSYICTCFLLPACIPVSRLSLQLCLQAFMSRSLHSIEVVNITAKKKKRIHCWWVIPI